VHEVNRKECVVKGFWFLVVGAQVFIMSGYVCLICHEVAMGILFTTVGNMITTMAAMAFLGARIASLKKDVEKLSHS
jgi:hypothetical protein